MHQNIQKHYVQVFKNTACMMHMGNMTKDFVPVGKEEQAEIKNEDNSIKVATLLGKILLSFSSNDSFVPGIVLNARLGWTNVLPSVWRRKTSSARMSARKYWQSMR